MGLRRIGHDSATEWQQEQCIYYTIMVWLFCVCAGVCVCVCSVPQSCLTLCDPMDCSPPGSSVHGVFQARTLEGVSISLFRGFSWTRDRMLISLASPTLAGRFFTTAHLLLLLSHFSRVRLCATRLPRPWDSPGKSTGVGCHCLLLGSSKPGNNYCNKENLWQSLELAQM